MMYLSAIILPIRIACGMVHTKQVAIKPVQLKKSMWLVLPNWRRERESQSDRKVMYVFLSGNVTQFVEFLIAQCFKKNHSHCS